MRHDLYHPRRFAPEPVSLWEFVSSALGAIALLGILLGSCTGARAIFAQEAAPPTAPPNHKVGVVLLDALDSVASHWTDDTAAVEDAWCLSHEAMRGESDPETEYHVARFAVHAILHDATNHSVRAMCRADLIVLHTHRPHLLMNGQVVRDCAPSRLDLASLRASGRPVGYIQCGKDAIVAYWPDRDTNSVRDRSSLGVRHAMPTSVFAAMLGVGLLANATIHYDTDPGGYHDGWTNDAAFPRKFVHGVIGFVIADGAMIAGVKPRESFVLTCAAAGAFEFTQGSPSWRDAVAGCGGAAVAAIWRAAWHR